MANNEERERNAAIIRHAVANADLDGLEQFMNQFARAACAEWLIKAMPGIARREFLKAMVVAHAPDLLEGASH